MDEQTRKQKIIALAQSDTVPVMIELLKDCRTQLTTIMADDEFHTLVNALTLEIETNLIQRVVIYVDDIRNGKLHEK